jgi:hypothetical protein
MVWVGLVNTVNAVICRQAFGDADMDIVPYAVAGVIVVWLVSIALAAAAMAAGMRSLSRRDL